MKSVAGLGLAFEERGETVQQWRDRAAKGLQFLLGVQAAGSYAAYVAEPRYELVLLRALCLSGRAKSYFEQTSLQTWIFKEETDQHHLATRLFGAGQEQELPLGCFEKVLDFWWQG